MRRTTTLALALVGAGLLLATCRDEDIPMSTDGSAASAADAAKAGSHDVGLPPEPDASAVDASAITMPDTGAAPADAAMPADAGSAARDVGVKPGRDASTIAPDAAAAFSIGGKVTGLAGTGLVLLNGGVDDLAIPGDGTFQFKTPIATGGIYEVTVMTQPASPWQTCSVAKGTGTVAASDVTNVAIDCVTNKYKVKVNVIGLAGTGLVLQDNSTDDLAVSASGVVEFATQVASGAAYAVSVMTQPSGPTQVCTVADPTGKIADTGVTVAVNCDALVWVSNHDLNAVQVVLPSAGGGVIATVPVGTSPNGLAFTPDGQKVYVANGGSGTLSVIKTASQKVMGTITVGDGPLSVAVAPDGLRVYVSNSGSKSVSVIDSAADTVIDTIPLAEGAGGLAVKPDGTELWASAGYGPDTLNIVAIPTNTVAHTQSGLSGFIGDMLTFSPDGKILYAASGCGCCGNLRRWDASTYGLITEQPWGNPGGGVAVSPDGSVVYSGYNGNGCSGGGQLVMLDGHTGSILSSVTLSVAGGMGISADGTVLYVLEFPQGNLVVADATSLATLRKISLGGVPTSVAEQPR